MTTVDGTKTSTPRRFFRALALAAWVAAGIAVPQPASASHYPVGSFCYDCHAISQSKMVANTQLIKRSQKTIDLNVTGGAPVPCLFCHEPNASSAPFDATRLRTDGGYKMAPVMDHFNAMARSKHPVALSSSTLDPAGLDCVDCHTGITSTTAGDTSGNATIHGVDASAVSLVPYASLITDGAAPTNSAEVSQLTCQASACHDVDGGGGTDYTAPLRHPFTSGISLNDAVGVPQCFDPNGVAGCHDSHGSADGESLVVLKNTSGANGQIATGVTVTPAECEVCHVADDGVGPANDWMTRGHGGSTYESLPDKPAASIGLTCLSCHNENVPHDWTRTNQRFGLPVGTSTSSVTGKGLRSVCTNCHMDATPHQGQAGCLDCHDPHGQGVGTNILMVRQEIPVGSPTDTVVFALSGKYDTATDFDYWRNGDTGGAAGSSRGICDNADCHGAVTNVGGNPIYPLGTYFTTYATDHAGGGQTAGSNCEGCHKHDSTAGSWGVGADVCGACHGYPPSNSDPYADNTDAVGVHDLHASQLGYGCSECHFGNSHNDGAWSSNTGSPVTPAFVDVAFSPTGNPNGTYSAATNTCANLTCHNPDDPVDGVPLAGGGLPGTARQAITANAPQWLDSVTPVLACTGCHGFTGPADTHYRHDNPAARNYDCRVCHNGLDAATNSYSAAHADGTLTDPALVSFDLSLAGLTVAIPNPYDNVTSECSNVYCHGSTLTASAGSDTSPVWGSAPTGACGACHDTDTTDTTVGTYLTTGNHTDHLAAAYGPNWGTADEAACANCHRAYAADEPSHVNGSKDFANIDTTTFVTSPLGTLPVTVPTAADTDRCSHCHSTATVDVLPVGPQVGTTRAKANWATDAFVLACLTCHNGTDPASNNADGTGRLAPDMLGDDTSYGAEVAGHNRTTGGYPVSNNSPAALACAGCHDTLNAAHLNDSDDTTYAGNRLLGTINGVGSLTTVTDACEACHANSGASPSTLKDINTHSNMGYAGNLENQAGSAGGANAFGTECAQCHEPHGMVENGTDANIYMINPTITVTTGTTVTNVRVAARSGAGSFNDGVGGDDLCVVCHTNAANSGFPMTHNSDGAHAAPGYAVNEVGNDCSACHVHNQDATLATADGLMPLGCDGCHAYPPATNAHAVHVTTAVIDCARCHQNDGLHNETGIRNATQYAGTAIATIRQNVDVVFDTFNPNGTYSQAKGARTGLGNGTCSVLYCHGADGPFPTVTMGGTDTTPEWNNNGTGACGTCHLDTTATWNGRGSNLHQKHVGTAAAGGYDQGCDLCHYGVTTDGTTVTDRSLHVNREADVAFNGSDSRLNTTLAPVSTYGGDTVVGAGYGTCDNTFCHSQATDLVPPFQQAPNSATMIWDGSGGTSCSNCHASAIGGGPGYADGTLIDGNPKANKHQEHRLNGTGCASCHGWFSTAFTTFHADGAYDPTGGTNNALDDFNFTRGVVGGGINGSCDTVVCHGGNAVAWADPGPFTCDICHGEVGSVPTATDVNDFTIGMEAAGAVMSKVASGEYSGWGHGAQAVACADCHDSGVYHASTSDLSGANPFRLVDQDGAADVQFSCSFDNAACHQGTTAGGLDYQAIVTHSSTEMDSPDYTPNYTWSFAPDCVNCHDPHGDGANLSMIQRELYDKATFTVTDGAGSPPDALANDNNALAFTDNTAGMNAGGTSYAQSAFPFSAICQECHEGTPGTNTPQGFVDQVSANFSGHPGYVSATADNAGDCSACHKHDTAFRPSGCDSCHGFPPVPAAYVGADGNSSYVLENYAGGGGMHYEHIVFLQSKIGPASTDARELCGPCHGDGSGSTDHNGAGQGTLGWPLSARTFVNIRSRATGNSWDGMSGDPLTATYGGTAVTAAGSAAGIDASVSSADSRCVGVDCHGNPSSSDTVEVLWWNVNLAANAPGTGNGTEESRTCEGCHDQTPAEARVYDAGGALQYTGSAPDAAGSYYGTLSGYSRGGHGDKTINSTDDPSFVDSGTGSTPLECADCHDAAVAHFPEPATGNIHRLANTTLENLTHSNTGLCNSCHAGADYPENHHPSYEGTFASSTTDVIPAGGQEIYTNPSTWTDQGGGHYEQNGYSASGVSGGPDFYIDWWGGAPGLGDQDPPPTPTPLAVLPLERYVLASGTSDRVMCVTCHNPHGTDLFTYDAMDGNAAPGGPNASIPDNNMLRLRDSDNTLCNACH
ncbi:MAG: CxxxxCH/CxxCH domain-containing protein [Deferrisomatales bacterium]|nr:CxxxxCH/CxxCH domain-containing protein [Deferrisomatales bacterium]